jgi:hypothetical protein
MDLTWTFFGSRLKPSGKIVGTRSGSGVGYCGEVDGICNTGLQRGGLGTGARTVGHCTLLDARVECSFLAIGYVIPDQNC